MRYMGSQHTKAINGKARRYHPPMYFSRIDNGLPVPNYTDEIVSTKIVKLIQSYTGVVNKMVWRK